MSKVSKIPKSVGEAIAEMELDRLYQKALMSSEGLTLEDTKKFDILIKNLRESQSESAKAFEEEYSRLQAKLENELPTNLLVDFVDASLGEDDASKEVIEEGVHSVSKEPSEEQDD